MNSSDRKTYNTYIEQMPENNTIQKVKKMKTLSNYVVMLAEEVSDELTFGSNRTNLANDELK